MARSNDRRQRRAVPARQREQKPTPQPTQAGRKCVLDYLQDTITSCEAALEAHGDACTCDVCCVISNMVGTLRVFHMVLAIS